MKRSKAGFISNSRRFLSTISAVIRPMLWKKVLLGLIIIVPVSVLIGITTNAFRGQGMPLIPQYMRGDVIKRIDTNNGGMGMFRGLLVDARPNQLYKRCHIPEAFNFPPGEFNFFYGLYFSGVPKDVPLFIYGRTLSRAYDEQLANQLYLKGHHDVTVVHLRLSCL